MKIEKLKPGELSPYENNARMHPEWQVTQIVRSIERFGFTNPILIDGRGGVIAGHGRLMAAQRLGLEEVPCIRLAHLSDVERRALVLADNKIAENATWDEDLLRKELSALASDDFDMGVMGFRMTSSAR